MRDANYSILFETKRGVFVVRNAITREHVLETTDITLLARMLVEDGTPEVGVKLMRGVLKSMRPDHTVQLSMLPEHMRWGRDD